MACMWQCWSAFHEGGTDALILRTSFNWWCSLLKSWMKSLRYLSVLLPQFSLFLFNFKIILYFQFQRCTKPGKEMWRRNSPLCVWLCCCCCSVEYLLYSCSCSCLLSSQHWLSEKTSVCLHLRLPHLRVCLVWRLFRKEGKIFQCLCIVEL